MDFGVMDVAPPTDRSDLARSRGKWHVAADRAKPLPYMHPETIKELISVLSTPEILQVSCQCTIVPSIQFLRTLPCCCCGCCAGEDRWGMHTLTNALAFVPTSSDGPNSAARRD